MHLTHRARVRLALAVLPFSTAVALAGPAPAPTMPAIDLPIDLASVATAIAAVGGVMLLTWAGIYVGFRLARKFIKRAGSTV